MNAPKTDTGKHNSQRGAAAVEFSIICMLLLLLVFGIIEFSILLYDKAVITNASREGARAGIVYAMDRSSSTVRAAARAAALTYCADNLISFGGGSPVPGVSIESSGTTAGNQLRVTVTYPYTFLVFPNIASSFGGSTEQGLLLRAQTIMRME
jgi:Flp pilus assembly protein TadG